MFVRALAHWPHVLAVGPPPEQGVEEAASDEADAILRNGTAAMPLRSASGVAVADMPTMRHSASASVLRPAAGRRSADAAMTSPDALLHAHVERLWTPLAPALAPDTSLLNRLDRVEQSGAAAVARCHGAAAASHAAEDGAQMCSSAMRGSFRELTAALLAPFSPFITMALKRPSMFASMKQASLARDTVAAAGTCKCH